MCLVLLLELCPILISPPNMDQRHLITLGSISSILTLQTGRPRGKFEKGNWCFVYSLNRKFLKYYQHFEEL